MVTGQAFSQVCYLAQVKPGGVTSVCIFRQTRKDCILTHYPFRAPFIYHETCCYGI